MQEGIIYDQINMPKIDILKIRLAISNDSIIGSGCDYVATCKHNHTEFEYPVYVPENIKHMNFNIDTIGNQYRKIVWAEDSYKGVTGVYIKDINNFSTSINNYAALSMMSSKLSKEQQEIA